MVYHGLLLTTGRSRRRLAAFFVGFKKYVFDHGLDGDPSDSHFTTPLWITVRGHYTGFGLSGKTYH